MKLTRVLTALAVLQLFAILPIPSPADSASFDPIYEEEVAPDSGAVSVLSNIGHPMAARATDGLRTGGHLLDSTLPRHHWKDSVYFQRQANGDVMITKFPADTHPGRVLFEKPEFELRIPAAEWSSIVASTSPCGETAENYGCAAALHAGGYPQVRDLFIADIADPVSPDGNVGPHGTEPQPPDSGSVYEGPQDDETQG